MLNLTQLVGFGDGGEKTYYVGSATGTDSATLPAHQAGDLLIAFAFRDGSTTVPGTPSGWTIFDGGSGGANSCAFKLGYKTAASSSETSGTWTNANSLIVVVMRNVSILAGEAGQVAVAADSGSATNVPTFGYFYKQDLNSIGGPVQMLAFAGHRSTNTNLNTISSFNLNTEAPEISPQPTVTATLIASTIDATDTAVAYLTATYNFPNVGSCELVPNYTFTGTSSGFFAVSLGVFLN